MFEGKRSGIRNITCYYWACALVLRQRVSFRRPIRGWFWNCHVHSQSDINHKKINRYGYYSPQEYICVFFKCLLTPKKKKNFRALHYVTTVSLSLVFIMLALLTPRMETHKGYDIHSGTTVTHGFTKMFPMPEKLCVNRKTETYWHH